MGPELVLSLVSAILIVVAGVLAQIRQNKEAVILRRQLELNTGLMQQMAGQTGNKEMLAEIIETREALLAASRPSGDDLERVLAQVPRLTEEYKKLQVNRATASESLLAQYRINWEPLARFAVSEFDNRIKKLIASGTPVEVTKLDGYKVAGIGQDGGNGQWLRIATVKGVELCLHWSSAQINSTTVSSGSLVIVVRLAGGRANEANPLNLTIGPTGASEGSKIFPPPGTGDPGKELADWVVTGINKGIETLMVLANSK